MSEIEQQSDDSNRMAHFDIIRGFALLGILLVNMNGFAHPVLAELIFAYEPRGTLDTITADALAILIRTKFYVLFSLLFGASFALMHIRSKEQNFSQVFLRRILILACIGLAHGFFVWTGDILLQYAISGFLLWLFYRKTRSSRLLKWGIGWLIFTYILFWLPYLLGEIEIRHSELGHSEYLNSLEVYERWVHHFTDNAALVYLTGNFAEITRIRIREFTEIMTHSISASTFLILGFFTLGAWLVRSERLIKINRYRRFYQRTAIVCVVVGLPLSIYGHLLIRGQSLIMHSFDTALGQSIYLAGGSILAFSYLSWLVLSNDRYMILQLMAPVGRMALSNYLFQSIFWTTVAYGYGLGLGDSIQSRFIQVLLAVGFFGLQIIVSHWWMRHFYYGPFEWVWRALTHLKKPRFRRLNQPE